MALPLANVELSDSFNTWRVRTNDMITAAVPAAGEAIISANVTFSGTITSSGNVAGNLSVTGDINAANFNSTSDARLKSNVVTADGSKVCDMRGVNYVKDDVPGAGVIAQELVEIAPELVVSDQRGYLSVRYDGLTAYLIEAVKDLQKQIDELKPK